MSLDVYKRQPYATIKIAKKHAPARAVKMLVTDMKGKFQEKVPGTGDFVMTISSVGRNNIVKNFSVKTGGQLVDFGTLYITCLLYTSIHWIHWMEKR